MDLEVRLVEIDHGQIHALPAPLPHLVCTDVSMRSIRLNVAVQFPEVHYRADFVLPSLNHGHERYESFSRAMLSLVIRHEPSLFDPQLQFLFVLSPHVFGWWILLHHVLQNVGTLSVPPFPRRSPMISCVVESHGEIWLLEPDMCLFRRAGRPAAEPEAHPSRR
ncbi:hypothetical protein M514_10207 [Trichuris suis]|uniref:Uncharacterized protein n=1 Tax=Trichuris suis TaxID=68888 RepID=A0A085LV48_9BILA|nr:hypothetical protein M513_10207 [Trichuris suis]KFD66252.1 hypothetical protein M514_10207 [Trichuris suis]